MLRSHHLPSSPPPHRPLAQDQLTVLAAPARDESAQRAPSTLQVVLDRSGSMRGGALTAAQEGLDRLLTRLDPSDSFGLVSFDDRVEVTVPTAPLSDKAAVRAAVAGVSPRGTTNLSAGYLRGLREARRAAGERGATLLLLSDGHANQGVLEHDQLNRRRGRPPARGGGVRAGDRPSAPSPSTTSSSFSSSRPTTRWCAAWESTCQPAPAGAPSTSSKARRRRSSSSR